MARELHPVPAQILFDHLRMFVSPRSKPQSGDSVTVHYTVSFTSDAKIRSQITVLNMTRLLPFSQGTLLDGTVFDSSVSKGRPFVFKIGQGQVGSPVHGLHGRIVSPCYEGGESKRAALASPSCTGHQGLG